MVDWQLWSLIVVTAFVLTPPLFREDFSNQCRACTEV